MNKELRKGEDPEFETLNEEEIAAFDKLKEKPASPPVLALTRNDLPYVVKTDAFDKQIGCVLQQKYPDKTI